MITLTANTRRAMRQLQRIRRRIPFAAKRAMDHTAQQLAKRGGLIQQEWARSFTVRKRSFPANVLRVRKARVQRGRVRPAQVVNVAAGRLLAERLRGGRFGLSRPIRAAHRLLRQRMERELRAVR